MKGTRLRSRWVAYAVMLLLAAESVAFTDVRTDRTCRLELGHFDVAGGGLRVLPDLPDLLPDGVPLSIFEDSDNDGVASDADIELVWPLSRRSLVDQALRTNGLSRFSQSGFFFVDALPVSTPAHRVYVRVWNAESRASASGSWVSPLTELRPGVQQLSYEFREWRFVAESNPTTLNPPAMDPASAVQSPQAIGSELLGCAPNPFNLQTSVRFRLGQDAVVSAQLYDLQGRLVRELTEQRYSTGEHNLPLDASGLGSGTYFLALNIDHRRQGMLKVLLVK